MNKVNKKVQRIIGGRVMNHQIDGANEFIKFACEQGFLYRAKIAWSMITGKPVYMRKVIL